MFAASTDHGNCIIAPPIFCRQRFVAVALVLHLICKTKTFQLVAGLFRTVSRIRVKGGLITQQERIALNAVMHITRSDSMALNEAVFVNSRVDRVAIGRL